MPMRLPEPMLVDAMSRLPGWAAGDGRIHRRFALETSQRQRVVDEIAALAERTDHDISVTQATDGVDVMLRTADVDGVSEIDIALAARINDLANGSAFVEVPRQRGQAQLNRQVTTYAAGAPADESDWWRDSDTREPLMGVPATESGLMPIPLPDTAPREPEPGIEIEQEPRGGEALGFGIRGAGEAPDPDAE
jgi:4a-hydroxytetrahydrobiopterin dehydratase